MGSNPKQSTLYCMQPAALTLVLFWLQVESDGEEQSQEYVFDTSRW